MADPMVTEQVTDDDDDASFVEDPEFIRRAHLFGVYAAALAGARSAEDVDDLERGMEVDLARRGRYWMSVGRGDFVDDDDEEADDA